MQEVRKVQLISFELSLRLTVEDFAGLLEPIKSDGGIFQSQLNRLREREGLSTKTELIASNVCALSRQTY